MANVFLPNLDGDTVDAPRRREDGCHGRRRRTAAGLLTLGGWCSGGPASASFCFSSFGRHFLKEGVWSWFWFQDPIFDGIASSKELGEDEGAWVALKGSKSKRNRYFCFLVYSSNIRLLLLQLRVCECTVGVDVGDGTTPELNSILSDIVMGCIVLGRR